MFSVPILTCLLLAAGAASQHLALDIPEVDAVVQDTLNKYSNYTHYKGANSTSNVTVASGNLTRPAFQNLVAVSDPTYWLADVTHQGISAFNTDKSYQVFRNVKDFGAKGTLPVPWGLIRDA